MRRHFKVNQTYRIGHRRLLLIILRVQCLVVSTMLRLTGSDDWIRLVMSGQDMLASLPLGGPAAGVQSRRKNSRLPLSRYRDRPVVQQVLDVEHLHENDDHSNEGGRDEHAQQSSDHP